MKNKINYIILFLLISSSVFSQNWQFVGPISHVQPNAVAADDFETSQLNRIVIDPNNPLHLFCGGGAAGLWESNDRGVSWQAINTNPTGFNGMLGIAFLNSTQVLIGNYHPSYNKGIGAMDNSTGVFSYNFINQTWQALGALPAGPLNYMIKSIAVYPNNQSLIFVCTSIGLFRSSNGGTSWSLIPNTFYVENMVFLPKVGGTSYYCYIAGSNAPGDYGAPTGMPMLKESSDDGLTFPVDLSSSITIGSGMMRGHSRVCVGPFNTGTGDYSIFTLSPETLGTPLAWDPYGWDTYGVFFLNKVTKNINTNVTTPTTYSTSGYSGMGGTRMALGYDPQNNWVWFGGQKLNYLNLNTNAFHYNPKGSVHTRNGYIHDDFHDIQIQQYGGQYEMFVANDGGIARTSLDPLSPNGVPYFYPMNNGLNVNIINGFAGATEQTNIYVIGGGDIVNTDIYDENQQKNIYTHQTWENDGALIDKFNDNNMFLDANNYDSYYITTEDGGQTLSGSKAYYWPLAGPTFAQGTYDAYQNGQGFTPRQFYQDPYRPGRIFQGKKIEGIFQYDYVSKTFLGKIIPFNIQPNINWSLTYPTGDWGIRGWARVRGLSFSPQTPNSIHFLINGYPDDPSHVGATSMPSIIKYIGPNLDDCWSGHNDAYNTSSPQWANITPNWANFSTIGSTNIVAPALYDINFVEIETSPWNKDVVYVLGYFPNNQGVMILKYDGTNWSNYSAGLPTSEYPFSMVMDHASNDGIYLSTDLGVYYRDASMASWIPYKTNLPIMYSSQMEVNLKENTVRAGTKGRGIWKSPLYCPTATNLVIPVGSTVGFKEGATVTTTSGSVNTTVTASTNPTIYRGTTTVTLLPGFTAAPTNGNNYFQAFIHGCTGGSTSSYQFYHSTVPKTSDSEELEIEDEHDVVISPNPNNGIFKITFKEEFEEEEQKVSENNNTSVTIYNSTGAVIYSKNKISSLQDEISINMESQKSGVYIAYITRNEKVRAIKFIKQ